MDKLAEIEDLTLRYYTYEGVVKALEKVRLVIKPGETLGIVGETGSGKSVTALALMGIVIPPGKIEGGNIRVFMDGGFIEVTRADENTLQRLRGRVVAMIFQEPSQALNPVYTIEDQIGEAYLTHMFADIYGQALKEVEEEIAEKPSSIILGIERLILRRFLKNRRDRLANLLGKLPLLRSYRRRVRRIVRNMVVEILRQMEIPDPERVASSYPHQLSGGMKQRAVIAMALACRPTILIADEPTTSLDVTIEAQILELMRTLKERYNATLLFITHDFGLIAEMAERVAVMYAGSVVEVADVLGIFTKPLHPYTQALLKAIPKIGVRELTPIEGSIPNLINPPAGCRFHPRCPYAFDKCRQVQPQLVHVGEGRLVACHLY
ncbi:Oligopeptide transport ATP-binding protein OppD [archaeon HR01]|nr:Oligopeptide transport ATP-binding protein OppD [archaeon HR01]